VKEPATHSKQKDPINSITTPDSEYGEGTSYTQKIAHGNTTVSAATHTDSHPPGDKTRKNGNTLTPGA
jgi:hypothetical protein